MKRIEENNNLKLDITKHNRKKDWKYKWQNIHYTKINF